MVLPLALAPSPLAVLKLPVPLAFAESPVATLWLPSLLALALVPQATLLVPTAAVAPAGPSGSLPSMLPPHTNCACAGGAARLAASAIASAEVEEINDKRMHFITAPTPAENILQNGNTVAAKP